MTMLTCDHCGREYNADEYLQCPDDTCEGGRESLHQLAQQILLLGMEISRRGLADAMCDYHGHTDSLSCRVYPKGMSYRVEDPHWPEIVHLDTSFERYPARALRDLRTCHQQLTDILTAGQVIHIDSLPRTAA